MKKILVFGLCILLASLLCGCIPIWYLIGELPQPTWRAPVYSPEPYWTSEDTPSPSWEGEDTPQEPEATAPVIHTDTAFIADPAYDKWDTWADTGRPLLPYAPVFIPGRMVYLDGDTKALYVADRDYARRQALLQGCEEAFYYREWVYCIKGNAIYRIQPQEIEPILVKQFGEQVKLTHIYLTGGALFYIAADAGTGIAAERLYSIGLDGQGSQLVREGVRRILFGGNGRLYYDRPVQGSVDGGSPEDYRFDVMAYDLGTGQSSLLLGGAAYYYGHHQDKAEWLFFWFRDRLVYRPGVDEDQRESTVYQITFSDHIKKAYLGSVEAIKGDNRFHQWLVGGDEPGQITVCDMATGEVSVVQRYDTVDYNDVVIISKTESFYRAFTLDGRFYVRTTAGHEYELVLRGERLELVGAED